MEKSWGAPCYTATQSSAPAEKVHTLHLLAESAGTCGIAEVLHAGC